MSSVDSREMIAEVFLRTFAPHGAMSPKAIDAAVRRACDRAGVARVGTHRLRHTVATELLGAGAALTEIAPVLRHTNLSTTAIYAKVDLLVMSPRADGLPAGLEDRDGPRPSAGRADPPAGAVGLAG